MERDKITGEEPAMPVTNAHVSEGLSIRLQFAITAMDVVTKPAFSLDKATTANNIKVWANRCFILADAMIEAANK